MKILWDKFFENLGFFIGGIAIAGMVPIFISFTMPPDKQIELIELTAILMPLVIINCMILQNKEWLVLTNG